MSHILFFFYCFSFLYCINLFFWNTYLLFHLVLSLKLVICMYFYFSCPGYELEVSSLNVEENK